MSTHSESNNFNPDVNKIEVEAATRSLGSEHSQEKVDSSMPVNSSVSNGNSSESSKSEPIQIGRWWQAWQVWGLLLVLISGSIGFSATSMLLRLPKTQNCDRVFWPTASASIRLYCAQTASQDKTVQGLLKAIDLVAVLPDNHPRRSIEISNAGRKKSSKLAKLNFKKAIWKKLLVLPSPYRKK
jgi:hypothetical protein